MLPGSPLLRFLYVFVFRLGFLDGRPGLTYAMFKFVQTFHVKAKIAELRRASSSLPGVEIDLCVNQAGCECQPAATVMGTGARGNPVDIATSGLEIRP